MAGLKARAKTLVELADSATFYVKKRPLVLDDKAQKLLAGPGSERLAALIPALEAVSDWTAPALEAAVRAAAESAAIKLGDLAQPLRAALTGGATSPPIFEVMAVLGRAESLGRLANSRR